MEKFKIVKINLFGKVKIYCSCKTKPCVYQMQGLTRQDSRVPQHLNVAEELSRIKREPCGFQTQGLTRAT